MAQIINRLSELVSNQIAAGEVIQRPSSVVKELMENAIDADSESISVSVVNGGKDEIQVYDEGKGIDYEDSVVAFERHATSKISVTDDIYALNTFGFRGEALASIASIAEVEMRTRQEEDELGTIVNIKGGELVSRRKDMVKKGTQFIISNLFYNVPARRRSLESKSVNRELESVKQEFIKIALCYPRHSFLLLSNAKEVYSLPVANLRRRVADIMGQKMTNSLLELYVDTSLVEIKGYLGKPETAKKRPSQYFFVNNRYFKHSGFSKAILSAYDGLLPQGDVQPSFFIYITVDPSKIDVNIHPSKTEVHFEEELDITQILLTAVKGCLGKNGIVPLIEFTSANAIEMTPVVDADDVLVDMVSFESKREDYNPFNESFSFSQALGVEQVKESSPFDSYYSKTKESSMSSISWERDVSIDSFESSENMIEELVSEGFSDNHVEIDSSDNTNRSIEVKITDEIVEIESNVLFTPLDDLDSIFTDVYAFGEKHIIAVMSMRMMIINIRRAMGRILFDRYSKSITDKYLPSQKILFPVDIVFSKQDMMLIEDSEEDLRSMGFEFDKFLGESINVTAVPIDFSIDSLNQFFESFLDALKSDSIENYSNSKRDKLVVSLVNSATSVRYQLKSKDEMRYMVKELLSSESFTITPNGKRIIVEVSVGDIDIMLG